MKNMIYLFVVSCTAFLQAETGMSIIDISQNPTRWTIETDHASYQIILTTDKNLTPGYFGPYAGERLFESPDWRIAPQSGTVLREIPYRGGFVDMTPALEVIFHDQNRELELEYQGYEVLEMNGYPLLRLDMKDTHYPLSVSIYLRVIPELDIIEKWLVIKNSGSQAIQIERAYSGSVLLPEGSYDLIHFSGDWGRENFPRRSRLTSGTKTIAIRGVRSHQHASFFMVRPTAEAGKNTGTVWFGGLIWPGNWHYDLEVNRFERTQISGGINFWDTHWILEQKSEFKTPAMVFGLSTEGDNGASRRMHCFTLDHVLPSPINKQPLKVLYNSWYATTFDVNEEDQVALAKIAKEIGVELFVIDDGWFKGRIDDHAGLGDWTPDENKFPNGLGPMIKRINDLGLAFGIWVEPEMVNPNSDLFRAHPEWVLHSPNRTAHEGRNQLVLNFARQDVKEFTIKWLDELLNGNNIEFIKWDMNRYISEAGWPEAKPEKQRELRIRYAHNLLDIIGTLRQRHPGVVFETCSGGGGRTNLGMLQVTDQIWTSDNTDAGDRLLIQNGYSHFLPARTMVNWVTDSEWHHKQTSLEFRFHVAMAGNLGIGNNLHNWTESDKAVARKMIALYKSIRHIIQFGDQYRLLDPFENPQSAVQFVTRDGDESVVFAYQTLETVPLAARRSATVVRLMLQGLDPGTIYDVRIDDSDEEVSGRALMSSGISIALAGNYKSQIIILKKK